MNSIQKMHEALKDNPALQKKITEEAARLAEGGKADAADALARAVRENLGIELTREELEPLFAKVRELDPEQLGQAAGGFDVAIASADPETSAKSRIVGGMAGKAVASVPVIGNVAEAVVSATVGYIASHIFGFID